MSEQEDRPIRRYRTRTGLFGEMLGPCPVPDAATAEQEDRPAERRYLKRLAAALAAELELPAHDSPSRGLAQLGADTFGSSAAAGLARYLEEPDLRARVIACLERAGFRHREDHLPTLSGGGTFSAYGSGRSGVTVTCDWWDAQLEDLFGLYARVREALQAAGFEVAERPGRLYVRPDADEDAP